MKHGYGQFCPLALAAETLCERWTLLIVSRLLGGCSHFNAIQRSLPRIRPAMLAKRLRELIEAGLVVSPSVPRGSMREYQLTEAGRALAPLIEGFSAWGHAWARDMSVDDLDPEFLAWAMHTRIQGERLPRGRFVIAFEFSGAPRDLSRFWLVAEDGEVDMCLDDPGFETDLQVESNLRLFIEAWRGIRDLRTEIRARRIAVSGAPAHVRRLPDWLNVDAPTPYERKAAGREQRLEQKWGQAPFPGHAARPRGATSS